MNKYVEEGIREILSDDKINPEAFKDKKFYITGSTGLIGSIICYTLLKIDGGIELFLPVRSIEKAKKTFGDDTRVHYIQTDILSIDDNDNDDDYDFIVHCASPTKSNFFVEQPVETLDAIVSGTKKVLELAKRCKKLKKFLYLSSMEMYGTATGVMDELTQGFIDPMSPRSSYSLGKRTAELYCKSYYEEYGVPTVNVRLAMCFGPGIPRSDNRACKYFCECAISNEDIILKSSGETIVNYCYITDAVRAILRLLDSEYAGELFNICNDNEGQTIKDMANLVASFAENKITVKIAKENDTKYAPVNSMILSNDKIKTQLGWFPQNDLKSSLHKTFLYLKSL